MLAIIPNGKKVIIEFKCGIDAIYELKRILSNFNTTNIAIASFDFKTLSLSKKEIPNVETYWIHDISELDSYLTEWIIEKSKIEKIDGLMINVDALNEDIVKYAHDENLKIYSWTVNSLSLAKQFSSWGLNGIITDKPGWIINQFKKTIVM
jgi:glycerophosphoryl diester phosphodiesterase